MFQRERMGKKGRGWNRKGRNGEGEGTDQEMKGR
jgi:hypothetical protein